MNHDKTSHFPPQGNHLKISRSISHSKPITPITIQLLTLTFTSHYWWHNQDDLITFQLPNHDDFFHLLGCIIMMSLPGNAPDL